VDKLEHILLNQIYLDEKCLAHVGLMHISVATCNIACPQTKLRSFVLMSNALAIN
jgi:hypothetical protein